MALFRLTGPERLEAVKRLIDSLPLDGRFEVGVREYHDKPSDAQKRYLHVLFGEIAEQAWVRGERFSARVWKAHYKALLIGTTEVTLPSGKKVEEPISTSHLSKKDMTEFIEGVKKDAIENLGVRFHDDHD